jgi:predicted component of type VI protein secretion system
MATQVPSLNIADRAHAETGILVEIPEGFDKTLGRDESADITLNDPAVSRRHARLYRSKDGVWLEDLGSTNGSYINGDRLVVPYRLRDGDEVTIGNSLATFHEAAPSSDATEIIALPNVMPGAIAPNVSGVPHSASATAAPRSEPPDVVTAGQEEAPVAAAAAAPAAGSLAAGVAPMASYAVPVVTPGDAQAVSSGVAEASTVPSDVAEAPPVPSDVAGTRAPDPVPLASSRPVVRSAGAAESEAADTGIACPTCSASNRSEAWFCRQCGRELRAIPFPAAQQASVPAWSSPQGLTNAYRAMGWQQFRQTMRARNGGRRVSYSESLAIPTILFRVILVLLVLAVAIAVLVILSEGVHRVLGI